MKRSFCRIVFPRQHCSCHRCRKVRAYCLLYIAYCLFPIWWSESKGHTKTYKKHNKNKEKKRKRKISPRAAGEELRQGGKAGRIQGPYQSTQKHKQKQKQEQREKEKEKEKPAGRRGRTPPRGQSGANPRAIQKHPKTTTKNTNKNREKKRKRKRSPLILYI